MIYGPAQLADAFRTVRKNTLQIASDIPEDQYGFRATPDVMSVRDMLAHIATGTLWSLQAHRIERVSHISREMFMGYLGQAARAAADLTSKAQILDALQQNGDEFASWLASLDEATLAETVSFPPPLQPSGKSRLEMLLGVKEHEMHHRAQLFLIERLLGIVPHLTRNRQAAPR